MNDYLAPGVNSSQIGMDLLAIIGIFLVLLSWTTAMLISFYPKRWMITLLV